ncbi:hypothetical protein BKA70DRAFT_1261051 [Coprinopsis sp. MPI-PUGE-AT-0042]|nr:hypothetical protein BKA70DRAFT_1261051 [Coprinopsis sp. MPI-PUGE-AT-0042]
MNFFDTAWDVTRTPTPQPPAAAATATASASTQPEAQEAPPSLNDEVTQVIGQLGRLWGGFRAQSQKVLETARKDLGDVVVQAQKELGKLSSPVEPTDPNASQATTSSGETSDNGEQTTRSATSPPASPTAFTSAAGVFSRLQSALPPNIVATVQSHIPESIKHASENVDLAQIRSNLFTEFQRVQGITRAQAEEYARKGEVYLQEVVKEANEVLKDAVKIIPPEEAAAGGEGSGMVWDGTDMWMLPTAESTATREAGEGSSKQAGETQTAAVASRALALVQRLQSDPSIIKHDPEAEEAGKDLYRKWMEQQVESKGGIEGDEWKAKSDALLKENTTLYEMYTSLVPADLTKETFWSRYHFRAHQITAEEERRKALIQATTESDEDFSWEGSDSEEEKADKGKEAKVEEDDDEDDDEEEEESDEDDSSSEEEDDDDDEASSVASTPANAAKPTQSTKDLAAPSTESSTRASSLDGFAVVPSTNTSAAAGGDKKIPKPAESESEEDSDWE